MRKAAALVAKALREQISALFATVPDFPAYGQLGRDLKGLLQQAFNNSDHGSRPMSRRENADPEATLILSLMTHDPITRAYSAAEQRFVVSLIQDWPMRPETALSFLPRMHAYQETGDESKMAPLFELLKQTERAMTLESLQSTYVVQDGMEPPFDVAFIERHHVEEYLAAVQVGARVDSRNPLDGREREATGVISSAMITLFSARLPRT